MDRSEGFLSCDWGTTSFRLVLVSFPGFKARAEVSSKEGIARTFEEWKEAGSVEDDRFSFYLNIIRKNLSRLRKEVSFPLDNLPLIISGMASSSVGMVELPYKKFPISLDGSDLEVKSLPATADFPHPIYIITGVRTDDDVMRGEETQLIGCAASLSGPNNLFIHPGTHSKHVAIKNGKAVAFKSFMTGEFFSLLSSQSILAGAVEKSDAPDKRSFEKGVKAGINGNLLHEAFMVRTGSLLGKLNKIENYFYLSGLLIGTELKDLIKSGCGKITLSGEAALTSLYLEAFRVAGVVKDAAEIEIVDAQEATFKGQFQVLRHLSE